MQLDRETRNAFIVIAATLVVLLVIAIVFSGRQADAIYTGPPVHAERVETVAEVEAAAPDEPKAVAEAPAGEAEEAPPDAVAEAPADEAPAEDVAPEPAEEAPAQEVAAAPAEEVPAEQVPAEDVAAAPAEEAPAVEEATEEAPAEEPAPTEVAVAGDPAAGERVFRQCQACHQVGEGAQSRVGPALTGIIDRPAAEVEGFRYSAAMEAAADEGLVWSVENLHGFLSDPRGFLPGTSMAYAGVRAEEDLQNLIAYLATFE